MKVIYLFRHSLPEKNSGLENEFIPLSKKGEFLTEELVNKLNIKLPINVFSSTYLRAKQTAEIITNNVIIDERLIERKIGNKETFTKDLWAMQYIDNNLKNNNGESFGMVQNRMNDAINDILSKMHDNESVVIVSHAAAICSYLQQYCKIKVIDANTKHRRIIYDNQTILDGKIEAPSCFVLTFNDKLISISYVN